VIATVLMVFSWSGLIVGQEEVVDRFSVPFSNPAKPGLLEVDIYNGGIHVIGYEGKEVDIEVRTNFTKIEKKEEVSEKARGMTKIPVFSTEIEVEEEDNVMEIETGTDKHTYDFNIKVPKNTSLSLYTGHDGDISVENVNGEIEVETHHGRIILKNVSGSVIADGGEEDIIVVMNRTDPKKIMSFSNVHGDIDITFPPGIKANVKIKTNEGDIFSDFQIKRIENPKGIIQRGDGRDDGEYRILVERAFYGSIGGGGTEIQFNTYEGDIYLRKGK
jgi:hypothetical protein